MNHVSAKCIKDLSINGKTYSIYSLKLLEKELGFSLSSLPNTLKILLENLLRSNQDVKSLIQWPKRDGGDNEIDFYPTRVLMQDFTGVPAVVDLAVMRKAMQRLGGDPQKINPLTPVDLVIDHSVSIEHAGSNDAYEKNVEIEYQRNSERYTFLRWGQQAFKNFRVVPPGTGICHQVNLEYLAQVVWTKEDAVSKKTFLIPDTVVGTDSHTTMINGCAVLGWGVGGIEAEAAMLGQGISMLIPEVIGFELKGKLRTGVTATDLVLQVVEMLRAKGVVDKFVEFYGDGLSNLGLADRATLANMAPEYGATCGFFPIDEETIHFLSFSGRNPEQVKIVEAYAKEQGLWRDQSQKLVFSSTLSLDISSVEPCIAGPKRPQDRILLRQAKEKLAPSFPSAPVAVPGESYSLDNGHVVIAAITSCTNTSNPSVMVAAGLLAKAAREKGLKVKPWVKTSLAPGSQVVGAYLEKAKLQGPLNELGFNLVGYGCTTCIGNSGPLQEKISKTINEHKIVASAVLSGNRNFEGRINPDVQANFLASPPMVVAYAIAGTMNIDFEKESLGNGVYLKDIWPTNELIAKTINDCLGPDMFKEKYSNVFKGDHRWQNIKITQSPLYDFDPKSTFIKSAPYFETMEKTIPPVQDIHNAHILLLLGDSITTDHISPAGDISQKSPAGAYLKEKGVEPFLFNSYGSRRGNHEVMMRGTFANTRIKNLMMDGAVGPISKHFPSGVTGSVYDTAMRYQKDNVPLIVIAGKEYGTGSSRDWAAKGTNLLGVKAVIAQSFERIHRSNLIGMGILPLEFQHNACAQHLALKGDEIVTLSGFASNLTPKQIVQGRFIYSDGKDVDIDLVCRIDTQNEVEYFKNKGILHFVLRKLNT